MAYADSTVEQNGFDCKHCSESSVRLRVLQLRRPKTNELEKELSVSQSVAAYTFFTNITNEIYGEICHVEKFKISEILSTSVK